MARFHATNKLEGVRNVRSRNKFRSFKSFDRISIGSLVETAANPRIGVRRNHVTDHDVNSIRIIEPLYFKLIRIRKSLL